ncbi:dynamin family protein [Paenibacillus eucommiae]|uniref:GTPase Era involved in 16S rRNA processing n=1 Tax=Paenibacillus eucommiae TaxID=1355755 RepID=A0ABS4J6B3_9BACL|nr:dynamin family protein [Paenibacillus eucommiae]MBP1994801.1 GTPase Era involved in 16S rRNA processing [Paenibacillus eucommiae]
MNKVEAAGAVTMPEALQRIQLALLEAGDKNHGDKLQELLEKMNVGRMNIAFCGHFSAGKSTLINQLCGYPLLPSSPIPTSANIVSIRNGVSGAAVTHKENDVKGRLQEIALDDLEAYCVNGTDIESVAITYPIPLLGDHTALLDTPGIDSTDDAHHQSTESALHLADVVFYIMDYNHVQSEINLAFTKKMKEWGKPLYLLVNMIDKHKEHELPFSRYKEDTLQAFRSWGVEPDGLLFVTMKEPGHVHNEWSKLRWLIKGLIERGEELRLYSVDASAHYLIQEHGTWLSERNAPLRAELLEEASQASEDGEKQEQQAAETQVELERVQAFPEDLSAALRKEISSIIENANITPALTRDRADAYLQSRKPGFKVGFFSRAAQTAAEQSKRLQAFTEDLAEQVEAQLDWHLRGALKKASAANALQTEQLTAEIEALRVEVKPEWLAEQVNAGASFDGEYTLVYTRLVAAEIKQLYRKQAFAVIDLLAAASSEQAAEAASVLTQQLAALAERLRAARALQQLAHDEAAAQQQLLQMAAWRKVLPPQLPDLQRFTPMEETAAAPLSGGLHVVSSMDTILKAAAASAAQSAAAQPEAAAAAPTVTAAGGHGRRMERKAAALLAASSLIEAQPSMRSLARSMREKAERLRERTFTIALFGAFSAGKSSFANALLGERVLPVSPNPTTAAINRIVPPQEGWPHGTARVRMKSAAVILQDILYSLELLGLQAHDMTSALARISGLSPSQVTAKGKPHYSFLKAVEKGWEDAKDNLGSELRISKEQFTSYVADEAKSCFVELIDLFYSNPLTDQGIIFVDTPGADSIHARHTGVAFNYIKNADAILFVTYYNHAFSQADREFLLQLGRVKDSFEMDKMFFIVNAADLAASENELSGVIKHVETNLLQQGIRNPRIYPISSYLAAEGKINGNNELVQGSGIETFEKDFIRFTFEELSEVAIHAANLELSRADHMMQQWIEGAQESEAERKARSAQLKQAEVKAIQFIASADVLPEQKELAKEIQELLYYVKQRTTYRFGELYTLAFNPASFREDTHDLKKALLSAWQELRRMIAFDLSQEVLATTLRVENRMNLLASNKYKEWNEQIGAWIEGYESGAYENRSFATPEIAAQLVAPEVSEKLLSSLFRNAKYFFEGEGKAKLRAELETRLNEPIAILVEQQGKELIEAYADQFEAWLGALKQQHEQQLSEHVRGLLDALEMKIDIGELNRLQEQLKSHM